MTNLFNCSASKNKKKFCISPIFFIDIKLNDNYDYKWHTKGFTWLTSRTRKNICPMYNASKLSSKWLFFFSKSENFPIGFKKTKVQA